MPRIPRQMRGLEVLVFRAVVEHDIPNAPVLAEPIAMKLEHAPFEPGCQIKTVAFLKVEAWHPRSEGGRQDDRF